MAKVKKKRFSPEDLARKVFKNAKSHGTIGKIENNLVMYGIFEVPSPGFIGEGKNYPQSVTFTVKVIVIDMENPTKVSKEYVHPFENREEANVFLKEYINKFKDGKLILE